MATSKGSAKDKSHKSDSKKESSKKESKSKKDKDHKKDDEKVKQKERRKEVTSKVEVKERHETKKRKAEESVSVAEAEKKRKKKEKTEKSKGKDMKNKDVEDSVEADRRRVQGGAADTAVRNGQQNDQSLKAKGMKEKESKKDKNDKIERQEKSKTRKTPESNKAKGPCAAEALDEPGRPMPSKSRSPGIQLKSSPEPDAAQTQKTQKPIQKVPIQTQSSDHSDSETSGEKRRKRRENAGLKAATGFGLAPPPPAPAGDVFAASAVTYGPAGPLVPLPEKVSHLLEQQDSLAQEVVRMKMAVEAATGAPGASMKLDKEDPAESTLKMPTRLTDCLMEPDNRAKLLAKTGLLSATLNQEKHLILRAASRKQLQKTLGQLRRIAWACQWGCSSVKVGALLADKPAKAMNSIVVRLAATSSRLSSHDAKLNAKMRKIRLGTQAGTGMLVLEGIPGLSRKHCTITFEPEKGACYVQDVSTNGTYLNGKRLPRPPFKNPADARVRLFHGDELLFKLRTDDAEELGYVINLLELS